MTLLSTSLSNLKALLFMSRQASIWADLWLITWQAWRAAKYICSRDPHVSWTFAINLGRLIGFNPQVQLEDLEPNILKGRTQTAAINSMPGRRSVNKTSDIVNLDSTHAPRLSWNQQGVASHRPRAAGLGLWQPFRLQSVLQRSGITALHQRVYRLQ